MPSRLALSLYEISTWIIPLVIAITFHEAAHGFVARLFGDNTAWLAGRVSFNPLKHIDPFGTVLLPALLLITRSPFLFGYAKPVPVNFRALRNPKRDSVFVAAAGPAMNIALAILSALLFRLVPLLPAGASHWTAENLNNALVINVLLAVFNLLPISSSRRRPHPGRASAAGTFALARLARALWNDHSHRRALPPSLARCRDRASPQLRLAIRRSIDQRHCRRNPVDRRRALERDAIRLNRRRHRGHKPKKPRRRRQTDGAPTAHSCQLVTRPAHCRFERFQRVGARAGSNWTDENGGGLPVLAACEPEPRMRQPRWIPYRILGVEASQGHTISGRGFNLFKPLRRHFRS